MQEDRPEGNWQQANQGGYPEAAPVEESVEALKAAQAELRAEADRYLNNWRRAEADFQNYKRRADQERSDNQRFAGVSLIINILPIVDDLERALLTVDANLVGLTWFDGVRLIHRKLMLMLESAGVSAIQTESQTFDPRLHEAVTYMEGEDGKVLAEVQRGYKLHDRVLRPAMVVVGKSSGGESKPEEPKPEQE